MSNQPKIYRSKGVEKEIYNCLKWQKIARKYNDVNE